MPYLHESQLLREGSISQAEREDGAPRAHLQQHLRRLPPPPRQRRQRGMCRGSQPEGVRHVRQAGGRPGRLRQLAAPPRCQLHNLTGPPRQNHPPPGKPPPLSLSGWGRVSAVIGGTAAPPSLQVFMIRSLAVNHLW